MRSAIASASRTSSRWRAVSTRPAPPGVVVVGAPARRHRVAAAEHVLEQPGLRDVGVLVLVEEHGAESLPVGLPDLGMLAHDARREADLVPEVDHAELALQRVEELDRAG